MTDNDITFIVGWPTEPQMAQLRKVAAAAAAIERERCARACEDEARIWEADGSRMTHQMPKPVQLAMRQASQRSADIAALCAARIRARGAP